MTPFGISSELHSERANNAWEATTQNNTAQQEPISDGRSLLGTIANSMPTLYAVTFVTNAIFRCSIWRARGLLWKIFIGQEMQQ